MRRSLVLTIPLIAIVAMSQACSITREVRPVGQGNWAAGVSFGGPLFTNLGGAVPTPVLAPYGRYGILKDLDIDFGLDLTPAAIQGADVGLAYEFRDQLGSIPAVMGGIRGYGFVNALGWTTRIDSSTGQRFSLEPQAFEEVYANVSWKFGHPWLLWTGLDLFAQPETRSYLPSLVVGAEYRFTHIGIVLEAKDEAFATNQKFSTLEFVGPGSYGALALQIGLNIYPSGAP